MPRNRFAGVVEPSASSYGLGSATGGSAAGSPPPGKTGTLTGGGIAPAYTSGVWVGADGAGGGTGAVGCGSAAATGSVTAGASAAGSALGTPVHGFTGAGAPQVGSTPWGYGSGSGSAWRGLRPPATGRMSTAACACGAYAARGGA